MDLLRIQEVTTGAPFRLRLILTDGRAIERDVEDLLAGPVFEPVRTDAGLFRRAAAEGGTVCWPNGADLCPDVLIWGGAPPEAPADPPSDLRPWALKPAKQ